MYSTSDLLRSADGGPAEPDHAAIVRRGRRLSAYRTAGRLAGAAVAVAALAGVALLLFDGPTVHVPVIGDPPQEETAPIEPTPGRDDSRPGQGDGAAVTDGPGDRPTPSDGPSQSEADAERDGIHPEIAARSFTARVDVERASVGTGTPRVVADEGVWVVSRIPFHFWEDGTPLVGDQDGRYGRDLIDLNGYGEILLLDHDETRILRAFPFPDLGPQTLVVTDDAVYCARQGDGGLPDSMLCRIDRTTFEWSARIFPSTAETAATTGEDAYYGGYYYLPTGWAVGDEFTETLFMELRVDDDGLSVVGLDGQRRVDPTTLELVGPTQPAVHAGDLWDVERFLDFARAPEPATARAARFTDEVLLGLGDAVHTIVSLDDLSDPAVWVIDVVEFRGHAGPFSALELAAAAQDPVVTLGEREMCASATPPAPSGLEAGPGRHLSIQPDPGSIDSCLQWWAIDLFFDGLGDLAAVSVDRWEP